MRLHTSGFVLMHLALVASIVMPSVFLWDDEHIGNTVWHPHARFHAVQLWVLMMTATIVGIAVLWRARVRFKKHGARNALPLGLSILVPLAFWMGEFIAWPVPGADVRPDLDNPNTFSLFGFDVYGNAFGAAIVILLFVSGYVLAVTAMKRSTANSEGAAAVRIRDTVET